MAQHPGKMRGIQALGNLRDPQAEVDKVGVYLVFRRPRLVAVPHAINHRHRWPPAPQIGQLERIQMVVHGAPV